MEKINKSVVICALARDCEDALHKNIPAVEELRGRFVRSSVVIVENDSVDSTKAILNNWSLTHSNVEIISKDYSTLTLPAPTTDNPYPGTSMDRIEKMAFYRNIYLDWIFSHNKNFDLVIVIDIDIKSFNVTEVVTSILRAPEKWGGIFANGYTDTRIFSKVIYKMYHDMFAFCEEFPTNKPYFTFGEFFKQKKNMNSKLSKNKFLPVLSAFGGIGIYKFEAIDGLRYKTVENGDQYLQAVCEHVLFNLDIIKRDYQCFISRDMNVYYGESEKLIVLRNLIPLWLFKMLCLLVKFRKLKE
ncbi:hypothetical protein [Pedobacter sp. MR2016-24]|uniref:hypothetical protein n=1 Tax=Pedobacter sp. MR2016-24 TaxID=2994466 RepID=UPI0022453A16|nr:hypothetical protein [Pedobacter sp. MR2016-24]MCX2485259.1 hypothetical protein [Pedobacter sp. MR2016-24]